MQSAPNTVKVIAPGATQSTLAFVEPLTHGDVYNNQLDAGAGEFRDTASRGWLTGWQTDNTLRCD